MIVIFFEDGPLDTSWVDEGSDALILIDAADGVSANLNKADIISSHRYCVVYTNSILLLDGKYSYDNKRKRHLIFLRGEDGAWYPIQEFTSRELRLGHNIPHLYLGGEFGFHSRS